MVAGAALGATANSRQGCQIRARLRHRRRQLSAYINLLVEDLGVPRSFFARPIAQASCGSPEVQQRPSAETAAVERRILAIAEFGRHEWRNTMKTYYTVGLSMLAGAALGAGAIQGLHAQAKPPVYYIAEIEVTNPEAYGKEYAPKAQALIKSMGGKFVAIGGAAASAKVTAFDGEAPKRAVVQVWDSMEKIQAWRNNAEYKELRKTGEKYAKFRSFAVEGMPQ
jgi:uncharacterized protein (DUF1330 family)